MKFTTNEIKIMVGICNQLTSKEIAADLNLKHRTVEKYRDRLMHKTQSLNSVGIALYAVKNNYYTIN